MKPQRRRWQVASGRCVQSSAARAARERAAELGQLPPRTAPTAAPAAICGDGSRLLEERQAGAHRRRRRIEAARRQRVGVELEAIVVGIADARVLVVDDGDAVGREHHEVHLAAQVRARRRRTAPTSRNGSSRRTATPSSARANGVSRNAATCVRTSATSGSFGLVAVGGEQAVELGQRGVVGAVAAERRALEQAVRERAAPERIERRQRRVVDVDHDVGRRARATTPDAPADRARGTADSGAGRAGSRRAASPRP